MIIPPTSHVGIIMNFTGGPPGRMVDMRPLTSWVKVAIPFLLMIVLIIRMRIVLMGIEMTAYSPGSGAGMIAVVNVLSDDMHANMDASAISFDDRSVFFNVFHLLVSGGFLVLRIFLFHLVCSVLL